MQVCSMFLLFVIDRCVTNVVKNAYLSRVFLLLRCRDTSGTGKDTSLSSGTGTASASGGSFVRPESPHHYSSVSPCLGSGSYTYSSFQPNAHYTEISNSTIDSNSCKLAEMTIERFVKHFLLFFYFYYYAHMKTVDRQKLTFGIFRTLKRLDLFRVRTTKIIKNLKIITEMIKKA